MTNEIIPIAEMKAMCPECGSNLLPKGAEIDASGDTRLMCPTHGDQGSLNDFRRDFIEKHRGDLKKAADQLVERLRKGLKGGKL